MTVRRNCSPCSWERGRPARSSLDAGEPAQMLVIRPRIKKPSAPLRLCVKTSAPPTTPSNPPRSARTTAPPARRSPQGPCPTKPPRQRPDSGQDSHATSGSTWADRSRAYCFAHSPKRCAPPPLPSKSCRGQPHHRAAPPRGAGDSALRARLPQPERAAGCHADRGAA